jgi:hypothetical protein
MIGTGLARMPATSARWLHHQEVHTLLRVEIVNGSDVGMVELGESSGLMVEAFAGGFVRQRTRRQNFDGYFAVEVFIAGAINSTHSAGADLVDDAKVP